MKTGMSLRSICNFAYLLTCSVSRAYSHNSALFLPTILLKTLFDMKQLFSTLFLGIFGVTVATAQGIEFYHGTWAEAQEKAKAENKLIFVDAFASWCGPCKRMASTVFTQEKAGAFFNENFINLKIDMEKPENSEFASKYPVSAYPTLMFLDATGKLVSKDVGAKEVDALLEFARKVLGKTDKSADYEKAYNEGSRDPKLLYDYVKSLNQAGKPSLKITNEFLKTQPDLTSELNLRIIYEGTVEADSRVYDVLFKNQDKLAPLVGVKNLKERFENAAKNTVKKAIQFKNEALLEEAKNKLKIAVPERAAVFAAESDLKYYASTKEVKKYLKAAQVYQKIEVKNDPAQLIELVTSVLRAFPGDKDVLNQAEKWASTAAETGTVPGYYLTLAEVYKQQGDKAKARATAQKALQKAGEKDNNMKGQVDYFLYKLEG